MTYTSGLVQLYLERCFGGVVEFDAYCNIIHVIKCSAKDKIGMSS